MTSEITKSFYFQTLLCVNLKAANFRVAVAIVQSTQNDRGSTFAIHKKAAYRADAGNIGKICVHRAGAQHLHRLIQVSSDRFRRFANTCETSLCRRAV